MNQFIIVFSAEIMRRLRSRAFLVGLAIGALGIAAMLQLPSFLNSFASKSYRVVLAGDPSLISAARPLLERDYHIAARLPGVRVITPADLRTRENASSAIVLERASRGIRITVYAKDPGSVITSDLRRDLLPLQIGYSTSLSIREVRKLLKMPIEVKPLASKFGTAAAAERARVIANVMLFVLYILIVLNSQLILTSVAEEKTSRIAELLVSSVSPGTLLAGKIAASATLAILQLVLWSAVAFAMGGANAGSQATPDSLAAQSDAFSLMGISATDIAGFVVFFLLGYLQMATMFAAIGSLINRTEDIGAIGGPFFIPIVAALLIAITALEVPDAPLVLGASFIPLVAPFVMFARIIVSSVPLWQIALSLLVNVVAVLAIAVLGGRVYRVGMLLYGRPPKLAQLWHTLRV